MYVYPSDSSTSILEYETIAKGEWEQGKRRQGEVELNRAQPKEG